ncbi:hypothetical protein MPSEU_000716300 [Mayamaea pseudoterrestris]|nr:hypothetical protein MPSEU_000716300 [Mayamaea pseudoterrestris]
MILYERDVFGLRLLLRVHGSAVYKSLFPTLLSTSFFVAIKMSIPWCSLYLGASGCTPIEHPYVIGVLISFVAFLLTFRLNYAYGRYWDGATGIHLMLSKWLDSALALAAFGYQNQKYYVNQPKAFGKHPHLRRQDIVGGLQKWQLLEEGTKLAQAESLEAGLRKKNYVKLKLYNSMTKKKSYKEPKREPVPHPKGSLTKSISSIRADASKARIPIPLRFLRRFAATDRIETLETPHEPMTSQNIPYPSLFMQELAHLYSLLGAVALESLRANMEGVDMRIIEYIPGSPWPPVDPDYLNRDIRSEYGDQNALSSIFYFITGTSRTQEKRTLYNAARPLGVLGGVSDNEIAALRSCQGPYAKVTLCSMWLQEFITRESLKGSTGHVGTPILTRIYQFLSDGMKGYNQCRLIAYVPFPHPHAQIATCFSIVILFVLPLLFSGFVSSLGLGALMNTLTVGCFLGLHETARELERPFQSPPNDLPLTTFQAQLCEALISVYAAYNPNLFWKLKK